MHAATPEDLSGIDLFESLDEGARATIAPWFEVQKTSPGVALIGEGAMGYSLFVLREGTASVTVEGDEVRTLGPGDFFGELALLGRGQRSATVTTTSPATVLVLFGTEFRQLQQEHPEIAARIEAVVAARS